MPQDFKTTFIPKAPSAPAPQAPAGAGAVRVRRSVSIMTVLATLAALVAIVAVAGTFVFERSLESRIAFMENQLETAEKQFEPTLIASLQELDERLTVANQVLRSHRTVIPFFRSLGEQTLKSVQFDSFRFDYTDERAGVVQAQGEARSYEAIAQQSALLTQSPIVQEHIFSDFERQDTGRVSFRLLVEVSSAGMSFEEYVRTGAGLQSS